MDAIAHAFEQEENCSVSVNYAGSGTLFGSIQAGVEADIYIPGDIWYIEQATAKGFVASHRPLAWLVPVIAVRAGNPKGIRKLEDLARKDLEIGLGRAGSCAVGNVSRDLLAAAELTGRVKPVFEGLTVNQLADQVKLNALDAGIIWDAVAKQYAGGMDMVKIDDANFHAVPLGGAVLRTAQHAKLARAFVDFAAGEMGAQAFRSQHYQVPGKSIRVGCGSSMRPPIEDLAALFREKTGREARCNYGGSGTVLLQIQESGEGDVYICHDPFAYTCEQRKISERWHTIAYLEPTLAVARGNPKNVKGLKDLLRKDLHVGLPHSKYSTRGMMLWAALEKCGWDKMMRARRFYESRTHALINQLKLNTVDIAVLWDAPVKSMPEFDVVEIEDRFRVDAVTSATSKRRYSLKNVKVTAVRLNLSNEPLLAAQFAKICLSPEGQEILKRHCFRVPGNR